jgi:hypothetical protein
MSHRDIKSTVSELEKNVEELQEQLQERVNYLAQNDTVCSEIKGAIHGLNAAIEKLNFKPKEPKSE